ncbi:MAG: hypothetical protein GWO04_29455, partial [Actinobacteria bacterium]|nr:hypothetical protein [Actinomycetota bacterium]
MRLPLLALLALSFVACGDDADPPDAMVSDDAGPPADFGPALTCALPVMPDVTCEPLPTDYSPGADDMWEPCISDDGTYHRIQESISTIQRVRAFEEIATLL